ERDREHSSALQACGLLFMIGPKGWFMRSPNRQFPCPSSPQCRGIPRCAPHSPPSSWNLAAAPTPSTPPPLPPPGRLVDVGGWKLSIRHFADPHISGR